MNGKVGFIGAGNMGGAMIGGMVKSGKVAPENIIACELNETRRNDLRAEFGIQTTVEQDQVVKVADMIILAVKPHLYEVVLEAIQRKLRKDQLIVSIAAGVTMEQMEAVVGCDAKIVRTMPNTPALVGEGMTAVCVNQNVSEDELKFVLDLYGAFGKAEVMPEKLFHAVIGAAGSSPAYVFMFIEAIADSAVKAGMPRNQAYTFAAQAVKGAAQMVLETGVHPGQLKDMVCSPGGTTIEAVSTLEQTGFKGSVHKAIDACVKKSIAMSNQE